MQSGQVWSGTDESKQETETGEATPGKERDGVPGTRRTQGEQRPQPKAAEVAPAPESKGGEVENRPPAAESPAESQPPAREVEEEVPPVPEAIDTLFEEMAWLERQPDGADASPWDARVEVQMSAAALGFLAFSRSRRGRKPTDEETAGRNLPTLRRAA